MEDSMSMNSYMHHQKPVASKATTGGSSGSPQEPDDEESGWTAYFEDFSNYNREKEENSSYCSSFGSPSLVSDAASCAPWKLSLSNKHHAATTNTKMPKNLKFKKSRTKQVCDDDSLEDTASSPVNSPKVSDLEPIDQMSLRKPNNDHMYSSLGKRGASDHYSELQQAERRSMNFNIIGENDLKRRGLCLVPMSMLVNFLG